MTRLLIRDLRQVVSPAGRAAPLRGRDLRESRRARGRVRPLRRRAHRGGGRDARPRRRDLGGIDVDELDGRGLCAIPGLVDCHTHAAFCGDRVEEFALRAGGASYEELHAAGGGILSTVRATRAASEAELAAAVDRHRRLAAPLRHDDVGVEVRLRPRPRHGARIAPRDPRRGRDPDLARGARGAARARRTRTRTSTSSSPRCCPTPRGSPRPPTSSSSAARSTCTRPGATSKPAARAGLALRLHGDQFTESGAIPLAIELGARSVDHLEATGDDGVGGPRSAATSSASCCPPARSSSTGRCRRPASSSTRAPRSRSPPTSIPAARSARACRSSARSPPRSFT